MTFLFALLAFLTVYSYAIYPLIVWLWSRVRPNGWTQADTVPSVTVIVSAYNEERVIGAKIKNALTLDYPADRLEIIVASDGSTDRTNEIAQSCVDRRVTLLAAPVRQGKTACLNRAVPAARGEIVVFTDANAMFPPDSLHKLARHFADPAIGLVTGWTKYITAEGVEESTGLYARLERATKEAESSVSSCVGADGAVFAARRGLYRPLRDDDINDFVIPLDVIAQRHRVIVDSDVFCIEEPAEGEEREFRRQVRITTRALVAIWRRARFLNPIAYGSFAIFLLSHKVLRFLVPFFFVGSLLTALWLSRSGPIYATWAIGQAVFVGVGLAGILTRRGGRLVQVCAYFLLTLAAQTVGWTRWAMGITDVTWRPER